MYSDDFAMLAEPLKRRRLPVVSRDKRLAAKSGRYNDTPRSSMILLKLKSSREDIIPCCHAFNIVNHGN